MGPGGRVTLSPGTSASGKKLGADYGMKEIRLVSVSYLELAGYRKLTDSTTFEEGRSSEHGDEAIICRLDY